MTSWSTSVFYMHTDHITTLAKENQVLNQYFVVWITLDQFKRKNKQTNKNKIKQKQNTSTCVTVSGHLCIVCSFFLSKSEQVNF